MRFGKYLLLCLMAGFSFSYSLNISPDDISKTTFKKGFFTGWQMRKRERVCGTYVIPSGWWVYSNSSDLSSHRAGYYKFIAMENGLTPLDGIGDVVFGVFDSQKDANHTKKLLEKYGVNDIIVKYRNAETVEGPCENMSYGKTHLDKTLYYMDIALLEAKRIKNPSVNKKALIHDINIVISGLKKVGAKLPNSTKNGEK